ncbi:hypothetical protein CDL15_Pgr027875 [Punica granatum]|uniref:Uncharacterized protein n=1 Tax=Punica granatum TaxID=22663 RepID=A0A218XJV2_PUNGR|nr:hypothetical protein CDL15_Pgr027875 [Punica granatum]
MATFSAVCLNLKTAVFVCPNPQRRQLPPTACRAGKELKQREVAAAAAAKSGGLSLNSVTFSDSSDLSSTDFLGNLSSFINLANRAILDNSKNHVGANFFKKCETCGGKRAIECPGYVLTAKDLVSRAALSADKEA